MQGFVDVIDREQAAVDLDETVGTPAVEADDGRAHLHGDAVAVMVFPRRRAGGFDGRVVDLAEAAEGFRDLACLDFELARVGNVLVGAASAAGEKRAGRLHAVGGGIFNGERFGGGPLAGDADDAGGDAFARDDEGNENDPSLVAAEARAAVGEIGDFDLELVAGFHVAGMMNVLPPQGDRLPSGGPAG
jgi:hypothetical protein